MYTFPYSEFGLLYDRLGSIEKVSFADEPPTSS